MTRTATAFAANFRRRRFSWARRLREKNGTRSLRGRRNVILPGQYADVETGLNYNMWRDYDPTNGRYIESDPIGISAGVGTYAYANGNPIANTDAMGMAVEGSWITPPR